jgi:hypothetical protein
MLRAVLALLLLAFQVDTFRPDNDLFLINRGRPILDAHNCYPYDGKWADRIDRALSTGFPVAIEQDIAPYRDTPSGEVIAKVTHRSTANGQDPTLKQYFFERVRPIVETALKDNNKDRWPLIILHFDFKDNTPSTLEAVWKVLGEYQDWITTASKTANDADLTRLDWKPLLVLTEDNDTQEQVFYRRLAPGNKLRLFGSAQLNQKVFGGLNQKQREYALAHAAPSLLLTTRATNYRRWWNNSWLEVEEGGQRRAGAWTTADDQRLLELTDHAHRMGYWIRFYTLDGFTPSQARGWDAAYNFGSAPAVAQRWRSALEDGVDLIATDQYEALNALMHERGAGGKVSPTK